MFQSEMPFSQPMSDELRLLCLAHARSAIVETRYTRMRCHNMAKKKNARRIAMAFWCLRVRPPECKWDLCQCVLSASTGDSFFVKAESNFFFFSYFAGRTIEFHRAKQIGMSRARNCYFRHSRAVENTRPQGLPHSFPSKTKQSAREPKRRTSSSRRSRKNSGSLCLTSFESFKDD